MCGKTCFSNALRLTPQVRPAIIVASTPGHQKSVPPPQRYALGMLSSTPDGVQTSFLFMRYKHNNQLSYQTSDSLVGYYAYSASTKMRFKPRVRHYHVYCVLGATARFVQVICMASTLGLSNDLISRVPPPPQRSALGMWFDRLLTGFRPHFC